MNLLNNRTDYMPQDNCEGLKVKGKHVHLDALAPPLELYNAVVDGLGLIRCHKGLANFRGSPCCWLIQHSFFAALGMCYSPWRSLSACASFWQHLDSHSTERRWPLCRPFLRDLSPVQGMPPCIAFNGMAQIYVGLAWCRCTNGSQKIRWCKG